MWQKMSLACFCGSLMVYIGVFAESEASFPESSFMAKQSYYCHGTYSVAFLG